MKLKVIFLIQVVFCCCMAAKIDFTGKYTPDTRGNYKKDDAGKYIPSDAGKYTPDIRGIYISDNRGRYVPDTRGLYKFIPVPVAVIRRPNPVASETTIPLEIITNSPPEVISQPPLEVLPPLISTNLEDSIPVDYDSNA